MRIAKTLLLALGGAQAFTTSTTPVCFGVARHVAVRPVLFMASSGEATEEEAPVTAAVQESSARPKPTSSSLNISQVRKMVAKLTADNFSSDLATMEPFLLREAGSTFYAKSMKRIAQKAKEVGMSVPEGYALEAKATTKRRNKQNEFIQAKEGERLAAEAEAAAAAAAAEAEAKEEPASEAEVEPAVEEAEPVLA